MGQTYNIYCDESCHLENDRQAAMVLGGVWCPAARVREANVAIRALKAKHGLAPDFEVKWTKVSPAKSEFYKELVDYFFDNPSLHLRALIVSDKTKLRHDAYGQTHDEWYYKKGSGTSSPASTETPISGSSTANGRAALPGAVPSSATPAIKGSWSGGTGRRGRSEPTFGFERRTTSSCCKVPRLRDLGATSS